MKSSFRTFVKIGFFLSGLAVIFGAFASHSLKTLLDPAKLQAFETGVRYHLIHSISLAIIALAHRHFDEKKLVVALRMMLIGLVLFSGSIYLIVLLNLLSLELPDELGLITPIGGLFLILSWFYLGFFSLNKKTDDAHTEHKRKHRRSRKDVDNALENPTNQADNK